MTTVTNGVVELERVVRPADFESRRVRVTLSYTVDDGADPATATAEVGDMAFAEVWRQLRRSEKEVGNNPQKEGNAAPPVTPIPAEGEQYGKPYLQQVKEAVEEAERTGRPAIVGHVTANPGAVSTITDSDLVAAVAKARARAVAPEQIKAEIAKLVDQVGMSMTTLDQEKRAGLLAALAALKAAA